jgi:hypothetical protein
LPKNKIPESVGPPAEAGTRHEVVPETDAVRREIESLLSTKDERGKSIGSAQYGVYVFYDYFEEPLYVGRTKERLGTRVRRHLTNQRTDAVAMSVLDPVEVADVELWPFDLRGKSKDEIERTLASAEYTVKKKVVNASKLKFVLNEKDIPTAKEIRFPNRTEGVSFLLRYMKPASTRTSESPSVPQR